MPLRHIGTIVIWEGNYNPDIKSIGYGGVFHEPYFRKNIPKDLVIFLNSEIYGEGHAVGFSALDV